ncbi:MAG: hypothetical protein ABIQ15_07205 [Nocardioides sp.]
MRARLLLAGALVAVLVVGGLVVWRVTDRGTEFARAVSLAPAGSVRLGWTDWAAVRTEVGLADGAQTSPAALDRLLTEAYDRDLSSASALGTSAETLQDSLGISPATLDWELYAQSPDGAALVLKVPDSLSFADLADGLERLGFARPDDSDGTWRGGPDVLAGVDGELTPELQYWTLLEDEGVVVTSDAAAYVATAAEAVTGDGERVDGLDDVVDPLGAPVSGLVYTGGYACEHLAMAQADATDQATADQLVVAAGTVSPLTGLALAARPGGRVLVTMSFESDDQARANADSRSVLATGPAIGQGGRFGDRFTLDSATADESVVTLRLTPVEGAYVLSDLSSGPVLFATC